MRRGWKDNHITLSRQRYWWGTELVVWMMLSVYGVPVLSSAPALRGHQRFVQHSAPTDVPPPASPSSATERVLALSLEDANRLALQNNLDFERGGLVPKVPHRQVE